MAKRRKTSEEIIEEKVKELNLTDEQVEMIGNIALQLTNQVNESNKALKKALKESNLFDLVKAINKVDYAKAHAPYEGVAIEKYRKIRKIKAKEIADVLDVNDATISKYENGTVDMPASKIIVLSKLLNTSADLLLKQDTRKLELGYLGKRAPIFDYDEKKRTFVETNLTYALDSNLKDIKDRVIVVRYPHQIKDLNLPKNCILFITTGNDALDYISNRYAAFMVEKTKEGDVEFFSYITPIKDDENRYSTMINFQYQRDGEIYTCRLNKLREMVQFVIHKIVIDFK